MGLDKIIPLERDRREKKPEKSRKLLLYPFEPALPLPQARQGINSTFALCHSLLKQSR